MTDQPRVQDELAFFSLAGQPETAREILTTLRAARRTLIAAVTTLTEETVGAGSTTGQAIIASYAGRLGDPEA